MANPMRHKMPSGKMTAAEFCKRVRISRSTLQRLRTTGVINPATTPMGQLTVYLYDDGNVNEYYEYKKGI